MRRVSVRSLRAKTVTILLVNTVIVNTVIPQWVVARKEFVTQLLFTAELLKNVHKKHICK